MEKRNVWFVGLYYQTAKVSAHKGKRNRKTIARQPQLKFQRTVTHFEKATSFPIRIRKQRKFLFD
jgi:hypothetical protein